MFNFFKRRQIIHGMNETIQAMKDRITELEKELTKQQKNNVELIEKAERLQSSNEGYAKIVSTLKQDIRKNLEIIRKQTRADLLYNALEAIGVIEAPTGKDYIKTHDNLMAQLQNQQRAAQSQHYRSNSILGQIFGRPL